MRRDIFGLQQHDDGSERSGTIRQLQLKSSRVESKDRFDCQVSTSGRQLRNTGIRRPSCAAAGAMLIRPSLATLTQHLLIKLRKTDKITRGTGNPIGEGSVNARMITPWGNGYCLLEMWR